MQENRQNDPRWPARLRELITDLGDAGPRNDVLRAETWIILNSVLIKDLRYHALRKWSFLSADIEDIASEKSLDLLMRAEAGTWSLNERSDGEITGFLSTVARNGLIDRLRKTGREELAGDEESRDVADSPTIISEGAPAADNLIETREFIVALQGCVGKLKRQWQRIWFFRTFYEMKSTEIAEHPDIVLKAAHVDVILQRSREALGRCMEERDLRLQALPPGSFLEVWLAFEAAAHPPQGGGK